MERPPGGGRGMVVRSSGSELLRSWRPRGRRRVDRGGRPPRRVGRRQRLRPGGAGPGLPGESVVAHSAGPRRGPAYRPWLQPVAGGTRPSSGTEPAQLKRVNQAETPGRPPPDTVVVNARNRRRKPYVRPARTRDANGIVDTHRKTETPRCNGGFPFALLPKSGPDQQAATRRFSRWRKPVALIGRHWQPSRLQVSRSGGIPQPTEPDLQRDETHRSTNMRQCPTPSALRPI